MSNDIQIRIIETTVYVRTYSREQLLSYLAKGGDFTEAEIETEFGSMTDAELAAEITGADGGWPNESVEEDMQDHGEVEGSVWHSRIVGTEPGAEVESDVVAWPLP